MSKVIFLDIDGTLVGHQRKVSSLVMEGLKKVRENGHHVFLCTGRNRIGVEDLMKLDLFDGAICSAGGYIEVNGQLIYEAGMTKDEIRLVRDVFEANDIAYNLEANFTAYQTPEMTLELIKAGRVMGNSEIERLLQERQIRSIDQYEGETIHTITYISEDEGSVLVAKKQLENQLHFLIYGKMITGLMNGELMKKGVHKGTGIMKVIEYYDLPISETIGFGDSMNDIEMLETCAYSVVMANGSDEVKQYANSVCEGVEEDGIYYELQRLGLI